jgi:hypothetical protein
MHTNAQRNSCSRLLTWTLVVGMCGARAASAQSAPAPQDFSGLAATRTSVEVIGNAGNRTSGQLLRFDAESVTLKSGRGEVTFDRRQVSRIYQRGDSLKNGMFVGVSVGVGLGSAMGLATQCGGIFEASRSCTRREKLRRASILGGTFGALGIGVGVDALITGRRLLYERGQITAAAIAVLPVVTHGGGGLVLSTWW